MEGEWGCGRRRGRSQDGVCNEQVTTMGNWSVVWLGTSEREYRACVKIVPPKGQKAGFFILQIPFIDRGLLPGASALSTSVFPFPWPSEKALRWKIIGAHRKERSVCTRMASAEGMWEGHQQLCHC